IVLPLGDAHLDLKAGWEGVHLQDMLCCESIIESFFFQRIQAS
ncbi:3665_t:CDS:1, partial [Gigaspora margarita]